MARELTERECYAWLMESLGNARDAARGLAQSRKDMRWQLIAGTLQQMQDKTKILIERSGALRPTPKTTWQ